MKKILLFSLLILSFLYSDVSASIFSQKDCPYTGDIAASLDGCLQDSDLVDASGPTLIEGNVKVQFIEWTNALAAFLGLIAVGAIVYGGLLMVISGGDEEKISKGKDIVKWSLLGFLGMITAGAIVRLVIEVMFSFG